MYERRSFSVGSFQVWNWSAEKAGTPVRMTWPVVGSVTARERVGTGTEAPVSRVVSMMKPGERSWMSEGHMFFRSALVNPARRGDSSTIVVQVFFHHSNDFMFEVSSPRDQGAMSSSIRLRLMPMSRPMSLMAWNESSAASRSRPLTCRRASAFGDVWGKEITVLAPVGLWMLSMPMNSSSVVILVCGSRNGCVLYRRRRFLGKLSTESMAAEMTLPYGPEGLSVRRSSRRRALRVGSEPMGFTQS